MRLIAQEDFITFSHRESFKYYYYINFRISNIRGQQKINFIREDGDSIFLQNVVVYLLVQQFLTLWLLRTPTESLLEAADL
jgi:hypothetical protein